MQTLIRADITAGKFGEMVPIVAGELVNIAKHAYQALQNEE
jgi:hypothetical protein